MEEWVPLREYPGYSISNYGRVRQDRFDRVLAKGRSQSGATYSRVMVNGVQVTRAVSSLVAAAFVPNPRPEQFTTPIHLDGDLTNCCAENLLWRPRWFAIKFTRQFRLELPNPPQWIRDKETREEYEDPWPPVMSFGLLYMDILLSIHNRTWVFPTMQSFEWVI